MDRELSIISQSRMENGDCIVIADKLQLGNIASLCDQVLEGENFWKILIS